MAKEKKEKEKEIGEITHWFDKIGVAVLSLRAPLAVGDRVKIVHGSEEFEETISSMQVDHKDVSSAKKGKDIAIKLSQRAKEGSKIFPVG